MATQLWPPARLRRTMAMALCAAALAACEPGRHPQPIALTPAPTAQPKTLEATLQLEADADELSFYPHIAHDARGNAVAVWEQFDGIRYNIWANHKPAGAGWGQAALIETHGAGHAYNPQVALDARGSAVAVWVQTNGTGTAHTIWANRFQAGAGWAGATPIETDLSAQAYSPHIAMDERGNAIAVWQQSDGKRFAIRASRYRAGAGWGAPEKIEAGKGHAGAPRPSLDNQGNALVVWQRYEGRRTQLRARRSAQGADWTAVSVSEAVAATTVVSGASAWR